MVINKIILGTSTPNRATLPFLNYTVYLPSFKIPAFRECIPGEIVLIKNKYYPESENNLVKRIAAVGGQTVTIIENLIFVDGFLYNYKYGKEKKPAQIDFSEDSNIENLFVPENKFFVIGDNFDSSYDSRDFGFVDRNDIIGKVCLIYASFDHEEGTRWSRFFRVPG